VESASPAITVRRLLALVFLSLGGCSVMSRPTVSPDHAAIERIDAHGIALAVTLAITNGNAEDMQLKGVTAHVVIDGRYDVGRVTVKQNVALLAGKPTKLTVPILVKWTDAVPLMVLGASDRPVPYVVDGLVFIGGPAVHFGVPYALTGNMAHEEIVQAARRSLPGFSRD
jgi:hypothetical protein